MFVAVLVGGLVEIWDCRVVSMVGSLIASLSFAATALAPNIIYLYFSSGIISGNKMII